MTSTAATMAATTGSGGCMGCTSTFICCNGQCVNPGNDNWTALVPTALVFAGAANPLDARPITEAREDQEKQALLALLAGWPRLDPGGGLSAKSALELLYPIERLRGMRAALDFLGGDR